MHLDCVNCIAMDTRLRRVVTGGDDCGIAVTRLPLSASSVATFLSTPLGVLSVAFDHSRLMAGCEDTAVRVWDAVLGEGCVQSHTLNPQPSTLNPQPSTLKF